MTFKLQFYIIPTTRSGDADTAFKADGTMNRRPADLSKTEPTVLNLADTFLSTAYHSKRKTDRWTVSHSQLTRESTCRPMTTSH